jgi:hypothetical protein
LFPGEGSALFGTLSLPEIRKLAVRTPQRAVPVI